MMLACWRRDDAIDPEMYSAAVAATLADFPRNVVDFVTDPRTGIASRLKFLPSVAEIREACEQEREKMWKRRHSSLLPRLPSVIETLSEPERRARYERIMHERYGARCAAEGRPVRLRPRDNWEWGDWADGKVPPPYVSKFARAGRRANVFVHADAPQYPEACRIVSTADPADWKLDPAGRPGIWLVLSLCPPARPWQQRYTLAERGESRLGTIDDVRVYDRQLTADELKETSR